MPARNPAQSNAAEIARILHAILTLANEHHSDAVIPYRPRFRKLAGSVNSSLLLQQIWYWFQRKHLTAFYKFIEPCGHIRYQAGDSWTEELGLSAAEFTTAMKHIATKVTGGTRKTDAYANSMVIWWTDSERVTWFDMNLINFARRVREVYQADGDEFPDLAAYLVRLDKQTSSDYPETQQSSATQKPENSDLPSFSESTSEINSTNSPEFSASGNCGNTGMVANVSSGIGRMQRASSDAPSGFRNPQKDTTDTLMPKVAQLVLRLLDDNYRKHSNKLTPRQLTDLTVTSLKDREGSLLPFTVQSLCERYLQEYEEWMQTIPSTFRDDFCGQLLTAGNIIRHLRNVTMRKHGFQAFMDRRGINILPQQLSSNVLHYFSDTGVVNEDESDYFGDLYSL